VFTLSINESCEGPYTQTECRSRLAEMFGDDWHWSPEMQDGSFLAKRNDTMEVLAEAIPA